MRKLTFSVIGIFILGAALASCGGGGGKSNLATDGFFGKLPAIYDSYNIEKAEMEADMKAEGEKVIKSGDISKAAKLYEEATEAGKALKADLEKKLAEEMPKSVGKEVPVSYSDELKKSESLFFDAKVTVGEYSGNAAMSIVLTANKEFTPTDSSAMDATFYFVCIDKDGNPLERSKWSNNPLNYRKRTIANGETFYNTPAAKSFGIETYPASRVNFAGVKFITKAEYDKVK